MLKRFLFSLILAMPAAAETVTATRTIRANAIITETDVTLFNAAVPNGYQRIVDVVGQEARVVLYPGRPILVDDIGPPALVTRNQIVQVHFRANGVEITTEGRALERGAIGDRLRLMNLSSRATLFGQVQGDGSILVKQ
ncbi:flagellar basal body P-ring formation chaperone FlgA [Sulfitobacter delicatus]|uniref:Flagella basal body P-ring formation protein FlgA n=1 Tax=Sulfitobacter delicatus TaxID=218672 RepID=A0A1G7I8S1_9RHOB|nr:flagellar basal body P-ring formation chaperone FlgA [Sulfitobacter delicatus]SDF09085.1 flagella basal body P-ring formation protein FlgA [Sulfitobacter delicatus]